MDKEIYMNTYTAEQATEQTVEQEKIAEQTERHTILNLLASAVIAKDRPLITYYRKISKEKGISQSSIKRAIKRLRKQGMDTIDTMDTRVQGEGDE